MSKTSRNPTGKGGFGDHPENAGRPLGAKGKNTLREYEKMMKGLKVIEKRTGVKFWELFWEKAYKNSSLMISGSRKLQPDMMSDEHSFSGDIKVNFEVISKRYNPIKKIYQDYDSKSKRFIKKDGTLEPRQIEDNSK